MYSMTITTVHGRVLAILPCKNRSMAMHTKDAIVHGNTRFARTSLVLWNGQPV